MGLIQRGSVIGRIGKSGTVPKLSGGAAYDVSKNSPSISFVNVNLADMAVVSGSEFTKFCVKANGENLEGLKAWRSTLKGIKFDITVTGVNNFTASTPPAYQRLRIFCRSTNSSGNFPVNQYFLTVDQLVAKNIPFTHKLSGIVTPDMIQTGKSLISTMYPTFDNVGSGSSGSPNYSTMICKATLLYNE